MKTALQELIERLEERKKKLSHADIDVCERVALGFAITQATELLEKEREQIETGFDYGVNVGLRGGLSKDAEQYYNETYKQ